MGSSKLVAAGAVVGALMAAGAANAQGFGGNGGSMYLKGLAGFTIPQNENFDINDRETGESAASGYDFDSGYALGVAVGYNVNPNLAIEGEYMYRNAETGFDNSDAGNEKTESNAFMVNALYKFDAMGAFKPYAGAGIGVADLNVETGEIGDLDSDYQFAYQLIGGVGYEVSPQWTLLGEVRYFGINDQTLENDIASFKAPYHTFDFLVGAAYTF